MRMVSGKTEEIEYSKIRKMFNAVGCKVLDLERIAVGTLRLGRLLTGHYRRLTRQEIDALLAL